MQKQTLVTIAVTVILTLLTIEVWGQRGTAGTAPLIESRYQISAVDGDTVFAIDTRSGTLWRYTGDIRFQKLAQLPAVE